MRSRLVQNEFPFLGSHSRVGWTLYPSIEDVRNFDSSSDLNKSSTILVFERRILNAEYDVCLVLCEKGMGWIRLPFLEDIVDKVVV